MIDFPSLLQQCAPHVAVSTMQAIIRAESGFNPLALNVNASLRLQRAPRTAGEAAAWARWLIGQGYSVDMGLMQINSHNLVHLKLSPEAAFDPCSNVRAGAAILTAQYSRAVRVQGTGTQALLQAISAYNTGNFHAGFRNGYVAKVVRVTPALMPPSSLLRGDSAARLADSALDGFPLTAAYAGGVAR
jgi:type IV secretion system protein VirB1